MAQLTVGDIIVRTLAAFLAGLVVGWERETHGRPAGLRTNILACCAAAATMMIAENFLVLNVNPSAAIGVDPQRLGAGILTGIGFLGAGTIMRHENFVRGVTTAASLWFVTVLGLAFGSGFFAIGFIGLAVALAALFVLPGFESNIKSDWYTTLRVTTTLDALSEEELRRRIQALGPEVSRMKLDYDLSQKQKTLTCDLKLKRSENINVGQTVVKDLALCVGVVRVEWT